MLEFDYMHMQTQLVLSKDYKKWNKHEDTLFRVTHGANPSNVLRELADLVMSRTYTPKQLSTIFKTTQRKGPLPVGHLLTIAIGTG